VNEKYGVPSDSFDEAHLLDDEMKLAAEDSSGIPGRRLSFRGDGGVRTTSRRRRIHHRRVIAVE